MLVSHLLTGFRVMVDQISELGSLWDRSHKKTNEQSVQLNSLPQWALLPYPSPLIGEVTPHHVPASHLIQECWLPRKCTVQVVLLAFFFFLYDESYSEWSFCSAVVHNSCKKSDFSCVNFKGLQSGIYIWKDLLREEFLFFISTTGNLDYL